MRHISYFIVENGPVFDHCQKWVQSFIDARKAAMEFAKKYGSDRCYTSSRTGTFAGARFAWQELPDDWTKPRGKDKLSWPKKKSAAELERKALPSADSFLGPLQDIVGEIPSNVEYRGGKTTKGMRQVAPFFGTSCYTFNGADGPFLIDVPNAKLAWKFMLADNPEYECTNGVHEYEFAFEGCREILKEEWDLLAAQHKAAKAKAA
jgi:hypothetical protein